MWKQTVNVWIYVNILMELNISSIENFFEESKKVNGLLIMNIQTTYKKQDLKVRLRNESDSTGKIKTSRYYSLRLSFTVTISAFLHIGHWFQNFRFFSIFRKISNLKMIKPFSRYSQNRKTRKNEKNIHSIVFTLSKKRNEQMILNESKQTFKTTTMTQRGKNLTKCSFWNTENIFALFVI